MEGRKKGKNKTRDWSPDEMHQLGLWCRRTDESMNRLLFTFILARFRFGISDHASFSAPVHEAISRDGAPSERTIVLAKLRVAVVTPHPRKRVQLGRGQIVGKAAVEEFQR